MTKFLYISIISLFLVPVNIHCQEVSEAQLSLKSYARWLERMNISQSTLSVDTMETDADNTVLYMKTNFDKFAWNKLDSLCKTQTHTSLPDLLMDRLDFDVDRQISKDKIVISGNSVLIIITQPKDSVLTDISQKLGVFDSQSYNLNAITFLLAKNRLKYDQKEKENIETIRNKIKLELLPVAKRGSEKSTSLKYASQLQLCDKGNTLVIEIDGIKGWIKSDKKYWEKIKLGFHFNQEGNQLVIDFDIDGYFASGRGDIKPQKSEFFKNPIDESDLTVFKTNTLINILNKIMYGK